MVIARSKIFPDSILRLYDTARECTNFNLWFILFCVTLWSSYFKNGYKNTYLRLHIETLSSYSVFFRVVLQQSFHRCVKFYKIFCGQFIHEDIPKTRGLQKLSQPMLGTSNENVIFMLPRSLKDQRTHLLFLQNRKLIKELISV